MAKFAAKLKDPRTCRVFVSSPFGGIEREREELVAKYFPQLSALCQTKGVHFVAVDMRWGITEDASSNSQTINICLREIDRSDIFVGIYGERYGTFGAKNEFVQSSIEMALKRYPFLKSVRDRSITEFEFLYGHLNRPGVLPATFAFRSKEYDDEQHAIAQKAGNEAEARKFIVENDAAKKLLTTLKDKVVKSKAKCLNVHVNYKTPEEAAKLLFEDIKSHLEKVLLKDTEAQSPRDQELACHDAYMATRTSFFVGGQAYMKQLDQTLQKGGNGHLVMGPPGCGKAALLSSWMTNVKKRKSHELIYNFVGCSKDSNSVSEILKRLQEELDIIAGVVQKKKGLEERDAEDAAPTEVSDLFHMLEVSLNKAAKKKKILIVIDGLSKVEGESRTSKTLFWLPAKLPPKAVTMVLTCRDSDTDIITELQHRGYATTTMAALSEKEQRDMCVGFLQQHGKELSASQLKTILSAKASQNPLYLKIVLAELCAFGNFRLLDSKIESLMKSSSVVELFEQFLIRLEKDYNGTRGKDDNLIQQLMCGLTLAKKGLTETEIRDMLHVPSAAWSPVYFAIKDFIIDYSGLLQIAFEDLKTAVQKRYMPSKAETTHYLRPMIDYFQKQRRALPLTVQAENASVGRVAHELTWLLRTMGDKEALVEVLTDLTLFARLFMDDEYELIELWRSTGRSAQQIVSLYLGAVEKRRKALIEESTKDSTIPVIDMFILSYLDALTYFLELNQYTGAVEVVLTQRLAVLEKAAGGPLPEEKRQRMLSMVKVKLSYVYAETGKLAEAKQLLEGVMDYRTKEVEKATGPSAKMAMKDLAGCYHALGLLSSKMGDLPQAVEYYKKSMLIHAKLERPVEYADSLNNLGVMLMKSGDYEQAADFCSKALKIYEEEYFGHLPPVIGVMIGNIAVCYRNLNKLDESEEMYKKALDIAERALGHNHPNVAVALTNLGTLEVNRSMYEKAEKYFSDALSIHKACLTPQNNNDLFKVREKYVYCLTKLDKKKETLDAFIQLYDQAVKGNMLSKSWPPVWLEMLSLLLGSGQASLAAKVASGLLTAGVKHEVLYTFLDKADRALKNTEKRPKEMTVEYALQQNPGSQLLLAYQAQEVLIPEGNSRQLCSLLDQSEAALNAGPNLYHAAMSWCKNKGQAKMIDVVLKHACDKYPDNVNFLSQLVTKLRDEEKFKEALPYAKRMASAKPDDVLVLLVAGEVILQADDLDSAAGLFTKAASIAKPGSPELRQAQQGLEIVSNLKGGKA